MIKTVCFTGHRPKDLIHNELEVKDLLKTAILKAIDDGAINFVVGGALGIDTYAGEIVADLKSNGYNIRLLIALPFKFEIFTARWKSADRLRLRNLLEVADGKAIGYDHFVMKAYQERNVFMVDRSDLVIAYWNGKLNGGTYNCIEYANSVGKQVINTFKASDNSGAFLDYNNTWTPRPHDQVKF